MSEVGNNEARDIEKIVDRILKDLGNPEPPLSLDHVRELLKLDIQFYNTNDPSTLDEVIHKMKVAGKQILARPTLILDAIKKANISALWVPDSKRIMIDQDVPKLKHRWIEGHEISHSFIPWHREFLFGDTEFTLDPVCHAMVEGEANYGAARLLFMQNKFAEEARDLEMNFSNIKMMAKRYGNTITSTLWRMVQDREPDRPVFGMISAHPNHPNIGPSNIENPWKHFIRSEAFKERFPNITPAEAYQILSQKAGWNKSGTVVNAIEVLKDANGEEYEFQIESFSNSHALLTYGVVIRKKETLVAAT